MILSSDKYKLALFSTIRDSILLSNIIKDKSMIDINKTARKIMDIKLQSLDYEKLKEDYDEGSRSLFNK